MISEKLVRPERPCGANDSFGGVVGDYSPHSREFDGKVACLEKKKAQPLAGPAWDGAETGVFASDPNAQTKRGSTSPQAAQSRKHMETKALLEATGATLPSELQ